MYSTITIIDGLKVIQSSLKYVYDLKELWRVLIKVRELGTGGDPKLPYKLIMLV